MFNKHYIYCAPFRLHFISQESEEETTGLYKSKRNTKITHTYGTAQLQSNVRTCTQDASVQALNLMIKLQ